MGEVNMGKQATLEDIFQILLEVFLDEHLKAIGQEPRYVRMKPQAPQQDDGPRA